MTKGLLPNQQSLGEAAKRIRHRHWWWCRRPNGFCDKPLWRSVATGLDLPIFQVVAFANRLEELANAGAERGDVSSFSAAEFGAALGMSEEEAARIFAALEDSAVRWIADSHVGDFYDRNPDREDETAGLRKRRERARIIIRKSLSALSRTGAIEAHARNTVEAELMSMPDEKLFRLVAELQRGELSTVTRDVRLSQRDIVTVTPEQSRVSKAEAVDNSELSARGESKEAAEGQKASAEPSSTGHGVTAEQWITTDGVMLVVERMQVVRTRAETLIARWLRDLDDCAVLKTIIEDAAIQTARPAQFLVIVTDQLRRHHEAAQNGPRLALGPTLLDAGKARKVGHG